MICKECGEDRRVGASGMYKSCHLNANCIRCQRFDAPKAINGLCNPCYWAWSERTTADWNAFLKEKKHG